MTLSLRALMSQQALRSVMQFDPVDGPGGHIFPPTYAEANGQKGGGLHVSDTMPDGTKRVLVDSVASQANRQEEALVRARETRTISFADVFVDLKGTEDPRGWLSATEMPHRLSDAILKDSTVDGVPFGKSDFGKKITSATIRDLTPLLEASPTTLLYGAWFSGWGVPHPLRLQRCVAAEIWADGAVFSQAAASRLCPFGLVSQLEFYQLKNGEGWTIDPAEAFEEKGKPVPYGSSRDATKRGKPAAAKHGNVTPTAKVRGITAETITLRWALPLAALRRLRFGDRAQANQAAQAYLTALALVARSLQHEQGYSLRSRCDLVPRGPLQIDLIGQDGKHETVTLDGKTALALLAEGEAMMREAGLSVGGRVEVQPSKSLVAAIIANRKLAANAEGEDAA